MQQLVKVAVLYGIFMVLFPGCGKKKRKSTQLYTNTSQGSLKDATSDLDTLAEKCGAGLDVADALGYNDYLGLIDGAKLKVEPPVVQVLDYGVYSSLIMKCEPLESASHIDYQAEYCRITVWDESESEKITEFDSYTGVEEINIDSNYLGQKLVVEARGCTTRSESECGQESQKTRKSTKAASDSELASHLMKMRENENKRGSLCLGLVDSAKQYKEKIDPEKMTKTQEVMYGLANYILNNPERFADFCAKNVIDYAVQTQQQLQEISQQSGEEGSALRLTEGPGSDSCKEYLQGLQNASGGAGLKLSRLGLADEIDDYHERVRRENEKNIKNNEIAKYATGGVLIAVGVVMLGVTVKLWRDFGKSLKANKENHVRNGDSRRNGLKEMKNQEIQRAQGVPPVKQEAPSKFPPELDSKGRPLVEFDDNNKKKRSYTYDDENKKASITEYGPDGVEETRKKALEFDDKGKLLKEVDTDLKNPGGAKVTTSEFGSDGLRTKESVTVDGKTSSKAFEYDDFGKVSKHVTTDPEGIKTSQFFGTDGSPTKQIVDSPVEDSTTKRSIVETPTGGDPVKKIVETKTVSDGKVIIEWDTSRPPKQLSFSTEKVTDGKVTTKKYFPKNDSIITPDNIRESLYDVSKTQTRIDEPFEGGRRISEFEGNDPKLGKGKETLIDSNGIKTINEFENDVQTKRTVIEPEFDGSGRRTGTKQLTMDSDFEKPRTQKSTSFDLDGKVTRQSDISLDYKSDTSQVSKRTETVFADPNSKLKPKSVVETVYDDTTGKFKEETSKKFKENGLDVESSSKTTLLDSDVNKRQRLDFDGDIGDTPKRRTNVTIDNDNPRSRVETEMVNANPNDGNMEKVKSTFEGDQLRSQTYYEDGSPVKKSQFDYDPQTGKASKITDFDAGGTKSQKIIDLDSNGAPKRIVDFDDAGKIKSTRTGAGTIDYDPVTGKAKAPDAPDLGGRSLSGDVSPRQKIDNSLSRPVSTDGKPLKYSDYDANIDSGKKPVSGDLDGKLKVDADGKFSAGAKAMAGSLLTMALLGGGITLLTQASFGLTNAGCNHPEPEKAFACEFGGVEEELIVLIDEYQVLQTKKDELIEQALRKAQSSQEEEVPAN